MSEIATVPQAPVAAPVAAPFTERDAFELDLRKAKVFAASTLVPAAYQDNIPNCMIALNMARRIGADPLMVAQNLYVVQGKPGWSAQFLIATFNNCGRFSSMKFEWRAGENKKPEWACRAYATELATGEKIIGSWVTWKMVEGEGWAKKSGSKWLTMPEQMLMYRSGAFLVRVYAPEIAMGLPTIEELRDVLPEVEINPAASKTDAVTAALKAKLAPEASAAPAEAAPPASEPAEEPAPTVDTDTGELLGVSFAEVDALMEKADTDEAKADCIDLARHLPEEQRVMLRKRHGAKFRQSAAAASE